MRDVMWRFAGMHKLGRRFFVIFYLIFIRGRLKVYFSPSNIKIYICAGRSAILSKLRHKGPLLPRPVVMIGLSLRCNIKCVFCITHSTVMAGINMPRPAPVSASGGESGNYLDFGAFKAVIDDMEYLDPSLILLTGNGEMLLYPRILEALDYIKSKKAFNGRVGISTNGVLLREDISGKMLESGVSSLNFSVNASNPATYSVMHSVGETAFHQTIANIKNFVRMADQSNNKPHITISFVLCRKNYKELPAMISLASSLGIKTAIFRAMLYCVGQGSILGEYILNDADKNDLEKFIFEGMREASNKKIATNLNLLQKILNKKSADCFRASVKHAYTLQIHADGTVNPYDFCYEIGNIYKRSVLDIWYSAKYIEFRSRIREAALKGGSLPNQPFCFRCKFAAIGSEDCRIIY